MAMYMPGRKQAQIEAFTACLPAHRGPYLEWCAGKGHLGRLVSLHRQAEVLSLELQAPLCEEGRQLAARDGARMAFVCADAFADETAQLIVPAHHAMALHACGELHTHLIEQVAARGAEGVTLSPCCYHLIRTSHYRPLSGPAKASVLQLAKSDLKLPLQETVTGGARIARLREQEVAWRLAFDCLQRQVRGVNEYLPVPNMQKSLLTGTFEDFCGWAAERKGLLLPAGLDYAGFLAKGEARYGDVARMELVRHLFRRPLELWLVLDRALFLQEQGYRVEVGGILRQANDPPQYPDPRGAHARKISGGPRRCGVCCSGLLFTLMSPIVAFVLLKERLFRSFFIFLRFIYIYPAAASKHRSTMHFMAAYRQSELAHSSDNILNSHREFSG